MLFEAQHGLKISKKEIIVNNRVQYLIDLAEYDLETASSLLKSKRYLYVGFMCH